MTHTPLTNERKQGVRALFLTQIFSTLSYSVLYSTLVLFITKGLKLGADNAIAITGTFVAFNYFLHLLGGYIGGRYLSYRLLFCIGMLTQTMGCAILAMVNVESLFWGLAIFLTGCGLNVTCVNCMLTQLFEPEDKNRETAFLWNYSGMNIGFFVGFTMSGFFQLGQNYSLLFMTAGLSNLIAMGVVLMYWKPLKDIGTHLTHVAAGKQFRLGTVGIGFIVVLTFALRWLLDHATFSNEFIIIIGIMMLMVIGGIAFQERVKEIGKKIWAFLILALASLIFWTLYQMAPMGLTLFYIHNVDHTFLGFTIPPQWLMNINTIIIILAGPTFAHFLKWMRSKKKMVRIPQQFAISLFLIGLGFVILPIGIHFSSSTGMTAFGWIALSYIFQSLGEILISPIGYAMIGQLIPAKLQGLMMGTWLMISGVAATLSNYFSQMSFNSGELSQPLQTNGSFAHSFHILGWSSIGASLLLMLLFPFLRKLIQERSPHENPHLFT